MKVQVTKINGRYYGYAGWKHSGIQSRIHLVESDFDGGIFSGAPTLCGLYFTDDADDERTTQGRPCGNCQRKAGTGKPRETGIDEIVRHAQAKSTGATITVTRVGPGSVYEQEPGWMTMCLNHSELVFHETRLLAVRHSSAPEGWCGGCGHIEAEGEKIQGAKLR
jgi:hypothetical protein